MKKIAVVLSGCGFQDGAEITESVSALIALSEAGADTQCFAPDLNFKSTNHRSGQPGDERNVIEEAARISRGHIQPLSELKEQDFDGVVFPGGFGAALHLSNWAEKGADCSVDENVQALVESFHKASKPIAALCIAPAMISRVLGDHNPSLTIGNDPATAAEIEKTGAQHENCAVDDYITDRMNKLITSPAYMYGDAKPHLVYKGIRGAIREFYEMA
ncbi:MAG: isoprenoid biosynthesis glyoxalase ElbB [Bdellovibrionales bacterium]|nr:isoprenoid biosynthesis glyoxalase ElbB [Bdellovibrionales bacterium]